MEDSISKPGNVNETVQIAPVQVMLTHGYWIGKYPVTHTEWQHMMKTEPWKRHIAVSTGDRIPASYITWNDAISFCRKLTEQERQAGRIANVIFRRDAGRRLQVPNVYFDCVHGDSFERGLGSKAQ